MSKMQATREQCAKGRVCLERLDAAKSFAEFEDAWRDLLVALQRVANKMENEAVQMARKHQDKSAVKAVKAKIDTIKSAIQSDKLLDYLSEARNSDEHTIAPITERVPASIGIKSAPGRRDFAASNVVFSGGRLSFNAHTPFEAVFLPARVEVLAVVGYRGRRVLPPTSHLGIPLPRTDPLTIGRLGADYYEGVIGELESLLP